MSIPGLAREIVAKRVAILALIPTLYGVLIGFGVTPPWSSEKVTGWVGGGITVLAGLVAIFWTRAGVTPANPALNPTAKGGQPLVVIPANMVGEFQNVGK